MKHRLNIALIVCLIITGCESMKIAQAPKEAAPWDQMHAIMARIKPPTFPNKQFTITDYGAVEGENNDSSEGIRKAIEACNKAGGGRVVVPPGKWLSGPITLKSNVNLHLNEGSTVLFKTDPKAYLPPVLTRFESVECYNYSPFIYALEQENIAVTGTGTLDGQASNQHWWPWVNARFGWQQGMPTANKGKLNTMGQNGTPVEQRIMGENDGLRPNFFQPYRCKNVMIEGVHIRRSPMWEINPVLCTNVIVRNLDIVSHGPNNDGCDPECCKDVLIEGCLFDTGDDCIAIKSGRNNDGRRVNVASENLIIRNCTMKDGHGGVTIGSEIAGSCRNVFVEDCKMDSPNLNAIFRFKSNAMRGGVIENIHMRNVTVGQVAQQVLQIDFAYEEGARGDFKPIARNITMDNVTVANTPQIVRVTGFEGVDINNILIKNSKFLQVARDNEIKWTNDVKMENCVIEKK